MQKQVDIKQAIFTYRIWWCVCRVSPITPFMSGHSKVKHGVAEEVLETPNTNMICVQAGSGEAKWSFFLRGSYCVYIVSGSIHM